MSKSRGKGGLTDFNAEDLELKPWEKYVLADVQLEIQFQREYSKYTFSEEELEGYRLKAQTPEYRAGTQSMIEFGLRAGLIKKVIVC